MNKGLSYLLFSSLLVLSVVGCSGGGGSDDSSEQPPSNQKPTANAGQDQTVDEQTEIMLEGSGSDSDGSIASYSWIQVSGDAVELTGQDSENLTFSSPVVKTEATLEFELTVTDNEGATDSDLVQVIVSPVLEQKLTLSGVAGTSPLVNATVSSEILGAKFESVTDDSGAYELLLEFDEDEELGSELVVLEVVGNASESKIKLVTIAGELQNLKAIGDDSGVVNSNLNPANDINIMSTAKLAHMAMKSGSIPQSIESYNELGNLLDGSSVLDIAVAINLAAYYSDEVPFADEIVNTWELAIDSDAVHSFLSRVKGSELKATYEIAKQEFLEDGTILLEEFDAPAFYVERRADSIYRLPITQEKFIFKENGTGTYKYISEEVEFSWSGVETLILDFSGRLILSEEVTEEIAGRNTLVTREYYINTISMIPIDSYEYVDLVSYKLEGQYRYPNGELADSVVDVSELKTFYKKSQALRPEDVVGVLSFPLEAPSLHTEQTKTVAHYGDLPEYRDEIVGRVSINNNGSYTSDSKLFENGTWSIYGTGVLGLVSSGHEASIKKLAKNTFEVEVYTADGDFLGVSVGTGAKRTANSLWASEESVVGVYNLPLEVSEQLSESWYNLKEDGSGEKGFVVDANNNGVLEQVEVTIEPIVWELTNGKLVVDEYRYTDSSSCAMPSPSCFIYRQRTFDLFEIEENSYFMHYEYKINTWPDTLDSLDPALTSLWTLYTYQIREWKKSNETPKYSQATQYKMKGKNTYPNKLESNERSKVKLLKSSAASSF